MENVKEQQSMKKKEEDRKLIPPQTYPADQKRGESGKQNISTRVVK